MKPFAGRFIERILQFARGRKSYRMDQNVEFTTKGFIGPGEGCVELLVALHITWKDEGIGNFGGKFAHVLLHALLVCKGQARAFSRESLGNGPTNGTMVGNTKHKRVFSF